MELYIKQGEIEEALKQVDRLTSNIQQRPALRSAVRGAGFAMQRNWIAAKAYLTAGYTAGCQDSFCLRWLTVTLIAAGETKEARKYLDEWIELEPTNAEACRYQQSMSGAKTDETTSDPATSDPATSDPTSRPWRVDTGDASQSESKPGATVSKSDPAKRTP
jgi:tetratricopeptide (TPR) repeat protein